MIELKNLSYKYPDSKDDFTFRDVSLSLKEGSFNVLIGRSGCGKSTLLKTIAGIYKEASGNILMSKKDMTVSMVFQSGGLLPWRTVSENLEIAFHGVNKEMKKVLQKTDLGKERIIDDELSKMKILEFKNSYPRALSGGQKQRVGIARALVVRPELLLLDEPFSALDTDTTKSLHQELLSIWKKNGMTILMVSHSVEEALLLADKVVVMKSGEIKEQISIGLPRPRDEEDQNFLGLSRRLKKMI